jgi:hypothetical protein
MLVWGARWDTVPIELSETRTCLPCGRPRSFTSRLSYRYTHVFWIFGKVREKHFEWLCSTCGSAIPAEERQIAGRLARNPIPFMRRWGWVVYAGGGAALVLYRFYDMVMNAP